jgi:NAD+ synthase (glutamine-hydrolysing)
MDFGFVKTAIAMPIVRVADCGFNVQQIEGLIKEAADLQAQIICFPELCITAYTCADLFFQHALISEAEDALGRLLESSKKHTLLCVVGVPVFNSGSLFNAAVAFQGGKILAVVPKTFLPASEKRWFVPASSAMRETIDLCGQTVPFGTNILLCSGQVCIGIEIGDDLWMPMPPSTIHAQQGATILLNLSASFEVIEKNNYRRSLVRQQSARCEAVYAYISAGFGESTTDLVYSGSGFIAENGSLLAEHERFALESKLTVADVDLERLTIDRKKNVGFTDNTLVEYVPYRVINFILSPFKKTNFARAVNTHPFVPSGNLDERCEELFSIQTAGLAKRLTHTGITKAILGISGGLDSTLALLAVVKTFDMLKIPRKNIIGITMPGFGTTGRTNTNAQALMKALDIEHREIDIKNACLQHFEDIGHDPTWCDACYENAQARERTQILMDIANKENALHIGTGDLSELALGWATYNGDHMSMYSINASVPKTLIPHLLQWMAMQTMAKAVGKTVLDIIDTPVSPELLPAGKKGEILQKTEALVGPYELHDFFLYYTIRFGFRPAKTFFLAQQAFAGKYDKAEIKKWITIFFKRFFSQQFKRSCAADGPKAGTVSLSPRGDWQMPSDAVPNLWINEIEEV